MLKNLQNIFDKLSKLYNYKLKKKFQADFFSIERFKSVVEFYKNQKYYVFGNVILVYNKLENSAKIDLKNTSSLNLFVISFKNNVFEYYLDEKKYQKLIQLYYVNYLKIPINNEKIFEIKQKDNLVRTFNINKNIKKNLILLLMIDGLSRYIGSHFDKLKKDFNYFPNFYSNSEWTLPSYSSLISGLHASRHMNYKPRTTYDNENISRVKSQTDMYKFFSERGYVTGVYSTYHRINPTYGFFEGVDHGKYCKNYEGFQLSNEILSQIKFFNNTSNLIFAHYMDAHHPPKGYRSMDFFLNQKISNKNYDLEEIEEIRKKNIKLKNVYKSYGKIFEDEKFNSFYFLENEIIRLLGNIKFENYDDYTIIIFGDHGTKITNKKKTSRR